MKHDRFLAFQVVSSSHIQFNFLKFIYFALKILKKTGRSTIFVNPNYNHYTLNSLCV
jgi:hypothetical protein